MGMKCFYLDHYVDSRLGKVTRAFCRAKGNGSNKLVCIAATYNNRDELYTISPWKFEKCPLFIGPYADKEGIQRQVKNLLEKIATAADLNVSELLE